jgi:hypothetical protein
MKSTHRLVDYPSPCGNISRGNMVLLQAVDEVSAERKGYPDMFAGVETPANIRNGIAQSIDTMGLFNYRIGDLAIFRKFISI